MATDPTEFHLAQINVGRLLAPLDAPETAGFVDALEPLNALADASPGFVWRLQSDGGNATDIRPFPDGSILVNMSVWQTLDDLRNYVYRSAHVDILRQRHAWFEKLAEVHLALWWLPAGRLPTLEEAAWRLDLLRSQGPTAEAFTFRTPFGPPVVARRRPPAVDAEFCWAG